MHAASVDLTEAAACLRDEQQVVELAARTLYEVFPRGLVSVFTMRGRPAIGIGAVAGVFEGGPVAMDAYYEHFPGAPQAYDRGFVPEVQRGRWIEPLHGPSHPSIYRKNPLYVHCLSHYGVFDHGRVLVCMGARPLALLGVSLRVGDAFTDAERRKIEACARSLVPSLRMAALAGAAAEAGDALDHMMLHRRDRALLLSWHGHVVGASPAAAAELRRDPTLLRELRCWIRARGPFGLGTHRVGRLEAHAHPCTAAGLPNVWMVLLAPADRRPAALSRRERTLLSHLSRGLRNREIADAMEIAPSTVKTMLERLYRKFSVRGRVELLARVEEAGLG